MTEMHQCPLCTNPLPGELLRTNQYAIVDAQEPLFPGFTRVVWLEHVSEMTDLDDQQRQSLMQTVFAVETVMRETLAPQKINLASLGNQVPHLHWHVIPRWHDDAAFPASVWGATTPTEASQIRQVTTQGLLKDYHQALWQHFNAKP
jgi:diadenosine tetraphosphate (Ap4A) HIT family hydrolase